MINRNAKLPAHHAQDTETTVNSDELWSAFSLSTHPGVGASWALRRGSHGTGPKKRPRPTTLFIRAAPIGPNNIARLCLGIAVFQNETNQLGFRSPSDPPSENAWEEDLSTLFLPRWAEFTFMILKTTCSSVQT